MTAEIDILGRAPIMKPAASRDENPDDLPPFSVLCAPLSAKVVSRRSYARSDNGLVAMECGITDARNLKQR